MSNTVLPLRHVTSGKELCDIVLETGAIDFDYTSITTQAIEELVSDISEFVANAQKPGTIAIRIARDKIATNLIARCKQYGTPLSAETFRRTCYDVDDSDSPAVVYGDWSEECLVIRLGSKGDVVSSADVSKLISGYCSSSDPKLDTANETEDCASMFNVMVTAQDDGWEEGAYEWEKSRILESTDEHIKARFASFDEEALQTLSSLPTLFMYEQNTDGLPRVGKIKRIQTRGGRDIRVIFEFDDNLPVMTIENLIKLKWELGLNDFEFSRTHWAVKQGDLYEILREAGLAPQPAVAAAAAEPKPDKPAAVETTPTKVFLVHGRDDGRKQAIARFLETRAGLNVIVLSERANRGRSILEKFQQEADATSYAVVLMTADDLGHLRPEFSPDGVAPKPRRRARQNVIFELGFFIGKLGSNRVCALVPDNVERPSDYDGIAYVPLDDGEAWQRPLITELHGADLPISPTWWKVD